MTSETLSKAPRFDMLRRHAVSIVLVTTLGRDREPGGGMTSLLRNPRVISALIAAWFIPTIVFWLRLSSHLLLNDGLVYRAGAEALLAGGDPWAATVNGYSYAAPPLELVPFIPGALVPVPVFMVAWGAICAASVLIVGRRLGWVWLPYPPLLHGAWLGNPAIPGMVAVMLGLPLLGLVLKPQLLFVGTRRAVAIFAVLSLLALALRPDFLAAISSLVGRYGDQSAVVNAWMTPWMIPVGISLIMLARRDRQAAAWLVMPAIGPAMGWYGYAMVLPVGSNWLSVACAIPVPGLGAGAIALYGISRYVGWSPSTTWTARRSPAADPGGVATTG